MAKSQEFHDLRRKGVGGSDAAAILGLDPYRSALQVYFEKTGELPPNADNKHTRRGELLEPVIADLFFEETGFKVRRNRFSREHPEYPWMRGNIDRMILSVTDEDGPGVLEIKAPSMFAHEAWKEGPPDSAFIQIQHYLAVFGWKWGYIAAWLGATDLLYFPVQRDEELIEAIIQVESTFWHEHVLKKVPPEGRISDAVLNQLYPKSTGREAVLKDPMRRWLDQYAEAQDIIKKAEGLKDEASEQIKLAMGDAEKAVYASNGMTYGISWKSQKPYLMWDTAALDKEPDLVKKYKTKTVSKRPLYVRRKEAQIGAADQPAQVSNL